MSCDYPYVSTPRVSARKYPGHRKGADEGGTPGQDRGQGFTIQYNTMSYYVVLYHDILYYIILYTIL